MTHLHIAVPTKTRFYASRIHVLKIKNLPSWFTLSRIRRIGSFHVVVLQRTARKCTKTSNARAELLFCSLTLLFGDVLVAVAVVVCLSSLLSTAATAGAGGATTGGPTAAATAPSAGTTGTWSGMKKENKEKF